MKKTTILCALVMLTFNAVSAQTTFDFNLANGAVDNGDNITQTLDGITVTVTGDPGIFLFDLSTYGGTSAETVASGGSVSSMTFTFDQPVGVNSILPLEGNALAMNYTFTPAGGNNLPVTVTMGDFGYVDGVSGTEADLNWYGITSFTVSGTVDAQFAMDNLEVYAISTTDTVFDFNLANGALDNGDNITQTLDGITVTVTGDPGIFLFDLSTYGGTSAETVASGGSVSSMTFTFDQPVGVKSIIPLEGNALAMNYTFTPAGGNNLPVTVTMGDFGYVDGVSGTEADLNWVGVTSFTVAGTVDAQFAMDNLEVYAISTTDTVFDFNLANGALDNGDNITQTLDGIAVTVTGDPGIFLFDLSTYGGTSAETVASGGSVSSMTFTFDQPVGVKSIIPLEGNALAMNYTFTPAGGNNLPVTVTMGDFGYVDGVSGTKADLNWVGVTSFTVSGTVDAQFAMDNLEVYTIDEDGTLSVKDTSNIQNQLAKVYPNPVEGMLYIKNVSDLKSIDVYNNLGQQVLQSKEARIDMSALSQGLYILQIHSSQGTQSKRVIKR